MKILIITGIIAVIAITTVFYIRHPLGKKAIINGHEIKLELAITEAEKEKGLGSRDSLAPDTGMLFVYQTKGKYGFWMKGMRFPLDFIWIDGNIIVDLSPNIPFPEKNTTQPISLTSRVPADKVLEVNAGVIDRLGIKIGDLVQFPN